MLIPPLGVTISSYTAKQSILISVVQQQLLSASSRSYNYPILISDPEVYNKLSEF